MEFKNKVNKVKDYQFLEVDEDLRRIAERESSKPLCTFGKNCYRKNPNHLQEYRHQPQSGSANQTNSNNKYGVKRGKITDFFTQKPTTVKKLTIESTKVANNKDNYEIEDSEEETIIKTVESKDKPNNSHSRETTPKRKKMSSFKTNSSSKTNTNSKNRLKRSNSDSDSEFNNDLKSILNEDKCLSEPKRMKTNSKKNTCSPNVRKLTFVETNNSKNCEKPIESIVETIPKFKISDKLKEEKIWFSPQLNSNVTSKEWNQIIKDIFLFEMPKDFFQLWQFCKTIKRQNPEDALVDTLGLRLVGPYDIVSGKLNKNNIKDREQILCHFRYFYDLPELQTTLASNKSGYHLGYFRDTPEEDNPVVVSNNCDKSCIIEGVADNICAAVFIEIQRLKTRETSNTDLKLIETKLKGFCDINKIDLKANSKIKYRKTKVNTKTFNNFGFIVPYDKKTEVGYRPLPLSDSELKKLLNTILKVDAETRNECKSLIDLQEIIQLVSYANDECDFGMGLELGIDLFCSGDQFFHKSALHLLSMAYNLLKREAFSLIIKAHLQNRRKGYKLDSI